MTTFFLTVEQRNNLVLENLPLARRIASSRKKKLSHIHFEELESAAYLGLVEAADRYDPSANDSFPAFAAFRVVGAVQDYLRELSWGSRSRPVRVKDIAVCDEKASEETIYNDDGFFDRLTKDLRGDDKAVLRKYYLENRKIKDIATQLGVHESRVSQIISAARQRLRQRWQHNASDLWLEAVA